MSLWIIEQCRAKVVFAKLKGAFFASVPPTEASFFSNTNVSLPHVCWNMNGSQATGHHFLIARYSRHLFKVLCVDLQKHKHIFVSLFIGEHSELFFSRQKPWIFQRYRQAISTVGKVLHHHCTGRHLSRLKIVHQEARKMIGKKKTVFQIQHFYTRTITCCCGI